MPYTPELCKLSVVGVRVQAGKGSTGVAGGPRVVDSSRSSKHNSKNNSKQQQQSPQQHQPQKQEQLQQQTQQQPQYGHLKQSGGGGGAAAPQGITRPQ